MDGWSPVPDWESWFNEGAGVAIADISGNGQPDLLVFRVDAVPDGQNAGYYRIGWDIDAAGRVTGWSPWLAVPDWFLGSMPAPMSRLRMSMATAFSTSLS